MVAAADQVDTTDPAGNFVTSETSNMAMEYVLSSVMVDLGADAGDLKCSEAVATKAAAMYDVQSGKVDECPAILTDACLQRVADVNAEYEYSQRLSVERSTWRLRCIG